MYIHRVYFNKLYRVFNPDRYEQSKEIERWYKDGGDTKFRYSYPLHSGSTVIDAGAYHGEWTDGIYKKYKCYIYAFEPVTKYFDLIKNKFKKTNKIKVFKEGLAGRNRKVKISIDDFASSTYKRSAKTENIQLVDIVEFCKTNKIDNIDLIKINIEGGEFELLERIINSGLINQIKFVQVQFHNFVPSAEQKMISLQRKLSKTHKQKYSYWFIWDSWVKKS